MNVLLRYFRLIFAFMGSVAFVQAAHTNQSELRKIKMNLHSEKFGDKKNPAILLNAGAGSQMLFWPDAFCEQLAAKGYFVIRYDYRDTGLSELIDYDKTPYNAMDLAHDAVGILQSYDVNKAHMIGFSMGGQVAQCLAAYLPESVRSLILMATSLDFKPGFDALEGKPIEKGKLSQCDADYVLLVNTAHKQKHLTQQQVYLQIWNMLDGSPLQFDESFYADQYNQTQARAGNKSPYINHAKSMKASYEMHAQAPTFIACPTLILHGKKDPVFPLDHAQAMHTAIKNSELILMDDFAHALSPRMFDRLVNEIDTFIKKQIV